MKHPRAPRKSTSTIKAKKYLGQNFLIDPHIKERIINACVLKPGDVVLEIGPGSGALTDLLVNEPVQLFAVETDPELFALLKARYPETQITLINSDILKYDFDQLPDDLIVIGNLPYNISTPILEHLIKFRHKIRAAYLTVQLEFGQRLIARENSKDYGSLSCFVRYFADGKILFKISKSCFRPIPKVTSCFLKLQFRDPPDRCQDETALFNLIRHAFQQRRKQISNALSAYVEPDQLAAALSKLAIDPQLRPENISLKNFIALVNELGKDRPSK